jgi:hypothetical protein
LKSRHAHRMRTMFIGRSSGIRPCMAPIVTFDAVASGRRCAAYVPVGEDRRV